MEKPTEILSNEHKNILKVIEALDNECNSLESGKKIDKTFLKRTINFIRTYADKFHHAKEEDILFVELCSDEVCMHCNPTEQMRYEHDLGRNFVKNLDQGLKEENMKKIIENARGYTNLLKEHIFKEDNILYPMADEALNEKKQKEIHAKFKSIEKKNNQKENLAFVKEIER